MTSFAANHRMLALVNRRLTGDLFLLYKYIRPV